MRLYVAGPYTDPDPERVAANIAAADAVARELALRGHLPFCPHNLMAGWENDRRLHHHDFMRICRAWLEQCEGLVLVGDWRASLGVQRELVWARTLHLCVFARWEDVPTDA